MRDLLRVENVRKHYDGTDALKGASFAVARGEVHALVGENGAGKSTLAKIISGAVNADAGQIFLEGNLVSIGNPLDAQRYGIGIIFQELDLFPSLTVAENMVIGNLQLESKTFVSFSEIERFCRPFLDLVGLNCSSRTPLSQLSISQMQLVAIARALSFQALLILMDEPTSSLTDEAVERLFQLISDLKNRGVSIVYVSHKMNEIFRICDRITVLRDGETIGTRVTSNTNVEELITMMVGRELKAHQRASRRSEEVLLSVSGLTTDKIHDISFDVHKGEVLGVAGLVGAGRSELGAALFGLDRLVAGSMRLNGKAVAPRSPRHAIDCGIGLLPEDRKLQGLMMQMSVLENSTMALLDRYESFGFVRPNQETAAAEALHRRSRLRAGSLKVPVHSLSGGNQQKVLLSKWLLADPSVLFLDDPTRGVDVVSKADIYEVIEELAAQGKGILLVSSELPELLRCCDRILVLRKGRNMGIVEARRTTQEEILSLAAGTDSSRVQRALPV